jgi:hypothetical protein
MIFNPEDYNTDEQLTSPAMKACPFCLGSNIDPQGWSNGEYITGPVCEDCGSCAGGVGGVGETSEENIGLWNNRPIEDTLRAELVRMTQMRDNFIREARMAEAKLAQLVVPSVWEKKV